MNEELKAKIEAGIDEYCKTGKRWSFTSDELKEALAAGWEKFQGADLTGANLTGARLTSANLMGANFRGADLMSANLTGANLRGAYLRGAYLRGAYLRGAYLGGAYLRGADLGGANLGGAKIDDGKTIAGYFTRTRIGSDNAEIQVAYNSTDIWIRRGCSGWLTPNEFLVRVDETHGDRLHGQIYRLTIKHICEVVELERQFSAQGG